MSWRPLTAESAKETQGLIERTIGLSRDTFCNSSYLRQGDGSYADPARDPAERKKLLTEAALGRDPVWPRALEVAKAARRQAELDIQRIAGEAERARAIVATKRDVELDHTETLAAEKEAAAELAQAETDLAKVTERYQTARDLISKREAATAELTAATQSLDQLRAAEARVIEASTQLTIARDELATLPTVLGTENLVTRERELLAAIADHEKATAAHQHATRENLRVEDARARLHVQAAAHVSAADNFRAKIATLREKPDTTCETCKQHLPDEARAAAIATYETNISENEAAAAKLTREAETMTAINVPAAPENAPPTAELEQVRAQLAAAQQAQQQRVRLEERVANYELTIRSEPDLADRIALAVALATAKRAALDDLEPVDVTAIEKAGALCRANVTAARAAVEQKRIELARLDEKIKAVLAAEQQLAESEKKSEALQTTVDECLTLERAFGRDGVPALILENRVIPQLEAEATRILADLGTSYQVELRTQEKNKDGGLRDTLEVVIVDDTGEAPYADFSGGEQTRIGLALRIALAKLLAQRRGAESRLLALDEPSYLDQAGMNALLEVLRGLQSDFDTILLVSHVPELRDALDQTITVVKDGGSSRVDGAPVAEAVAA